MKDSREPEWLDELQRRLGAYAECPDDEVWDKISTYIQARPDPLWVPAALRAGAITSLAILALSFLIRDNSIAGETTYAPEHKRPGRTEGSSIRHHNPSIEEEKVTCTSDDNAAGERSLRMHSGSELSFALVPAYHESETSALDVPTRELMNDVAISDTTEVAVVVQDLKPDPADEAASEKKTVVSSHSKNAVLFYGAVSGSQAFQKITPFQGDGISIASFYDKPMFAQDRLGFSLHAGVQSRLGRRLEWYTGLSLYRQAQTLVYSYHTDELIATQDESLDYVVTPETTRKTVAYKMLNAGVEAGLIYYLTGDRLLHKFGTGFAWQHGFARATSEDSYDNSRSQYLSYQLFYRNELAVSNRMNFFVQPFYKHIMFSKEILSEPFRLRSYYAGISFGILYRSR